jgi:hypothetical protein
MIPIALQDFLVKEMTDLFTGQTFINPVDPDGERVPMNVFAQELPGKNSQAPDPKLFPHIRVILVDGDDPDEDSPNTCRVALQIGVYDKGLDHQGHRDLAHIMQVIYQHLMSKRFFDNRYEIMYPFSWNFYDDDLKPYYYSEIQTNWIVGKITQKDEDFNP